MKLIIGFDIVAIQGPPYVLTPFLGLKSKERAKTYGRTCKCKIDKISLQCNFKKTRFSPNFTKKING